MKLIKLLSEFLESERAGGFILILCTVFSLIVTNSPIGTAYAGFWNFKIAGQSLVHWINDGLMALFFLLITLELKREFIEGQFRHLKNALLPIFAAIGGMVLPAACHALLNFGTPTQAGAGIPMATDAAFALAILSLVGKRAPLALKMLLLAIAVIDDLCAIIVIAVFYTTGLVWLNIGFALLIFGVLLLLNKLGFKHLLIYLTGGILMWYFMLHSGIHSTVSGVLLAITIPASKSNSNSPSEILQHKLHKPVAFIIIPVFALANTCLALGGDYIASLFTANSMGILLGLIVGKPLGVFLFSLLAVKFGVGSLHNDLNWKHVTGIGILAGIGFTISIFISLLAFSDANIVNTSKMAVLTGSIVSAILAFLWLNIVTVKGNKAGTYDDDLM